MSNEGQEEIFWIKGPAQDKHSLFRQSPFLKVKGPTLFFQIKCPALLKA